MSKAILVVDMPETCLECQFYKRIDETHFAEVYCCMALRKIMACDIYTEKHYDCPLKHIPEKKDEHVKLDSLELTSIINAENRGYNNAINDIFGEEE